MGQAVMPRQVHWQGAPLLSLSLVAAAGVGVAFHLAQGGGMAGQRGNGPVPGRHSPAADVAVSYALPQTAAVHPVVAGPALRVPPKDATVPKAEPVAMAVTVSQPVSPPPKVAVMTAPPPAPITDASAPPPVEPSPVAPEQAQAVETPAAQPIMALEEAPSPAPEPVAAPVAAQEEGPPPVISAATMDWLLHVAPQEEAARDATDRPAPAQIAVDEPPLTPDMPERIEPAPVAADAPVDHAPVFRTGRTKPVASPIARTRQKPAPAVASAQVKPPAAPALAVRTPIRIKGAPSGTIALWISHGDGGKPQAAAANMWLRVADLLDKLRPEMDTDLYHRLRAARAAQALVTIEMLRSRGIAVRFDSEGKLEIG